MPPEATSHVLSTKRSQRPLWREPIAIGIATLTILGSLLMLFQDKLFPGPRANPTDKSAIPAGSAGGGFCDIPAPVKSLGYNPSTRKSTK